MDIISVKREPIFTKPWLYNRAILIAIISGVFALFALGISSLTYSRESMGLLNHVAGEKIVTSASLCFILEAVTMYTLMLIEVAFRKIINPFQYGLIGAAIFVFYFLLTAMAELMPFSVAYSIVTIMIVGLIGCFIYGITHNKRAVIISAITMLVEYAFLIVLLYIGKLALLLGSLCLFILIALAMYFTLKLKIEDEELTLN